MSRICGVFLLLAALVLSITTATSAATGPNLVINGSFEDGWIVNKDTPVKQQVNGWTASVLHHDELLPVKESVDGKLALGMVTSTRRNAGVLNSVGLPVQGGKTYKFSYWLLLKEGANAVGVIDNTAGAFIRETQKRHFVEEYVQGQWQYFEFTFTVPVTSEAIRVCVSQSPVSDVERTVFYLDQVQIVLVD